MTTWEQLGRDHPHLSQWTDIGIQWATTYYKKMDNLSAYVIAMCELMFGFIHHLLTFYLTWPVLNPSIRLSWIRRHWEPNYVARAIVIIKNTIRFSVCYGDSTLIYLLQMQKYHDRLHGQHQQPTSGTAASQQQRQSWHDLAGQYGLEDMLNVSGSSSQWGEGVEEQFELYETGPLTPHGTDIVGFWAVSTISLFFNLRTDLFADKR